MSSSLFKNRNRAPGGAGGAPSQNDQQEMERENDEILSALLQDVKYLKKASTDVRDEVQEHNVFLDTLANSFHGAKDGLKKTMQKLESVAGNTTNAHMWILFAAVFGTFFFIYLLLKFS